MLRNGGFRIGAPPVVDAVNSAVGRHPDGMRVALCGADLVTHRTQLSDDFNARPRLDRRLVRHPLLVHAREIHGPSSVEPVVGDAQHDGQDRVDDRP